LFSEREGESLLKEKIEEVVISGKMSGAFYKPEG
jgi:hypothetical protein